MVEQKQTPKRGILSRLILATTNIYVLFLALYLVIRLILPTGTWWINFLNNFTPLYFLPLFIFLPLTLLLRSVASAARIIILLLIGAFWFSGLFVPKSRVIASASDTSIKLTTFNIHSGERPTGDILLWIEQQNADIIALQEVRTDIPLPDNAIELDHGDRWGTVLLTEHPVISADYITLADSLSTRNIRAVIDIKGQEIAVYAIHISTPVKSTTPHIPLPKAINRIFRTINYYDDSLRNQQIDALLNMLESETLPYIVLGDFNTSEFDAQYANFSAHMSDAFRNTNTGFGMTFNTSIPLLRIDYIWHDENFRAVSASVGEDGGSDHYPLHATLSTKSVRSE